VRALFDRDYVLASPWYRERLEAYRDREIAYIAASIDRLRAIPRRERRGGIRRRAPRPHRALPDRGAAGRSSRRPSYIDMIKGSIGLDPLFRGIAKDQA
jgi:hypothetical protein